MKRRTNEIDCELEKREYTVGKIVKGRKMEHKNYQLKLMKRSKCRQNEEETRKLNTNK